MKSRILPLINIIYLVGLINTGCDQDLGDIEDVPTSNAIIDDGDSLAGLAGGSDSSDFGSVDREVIINGVPWVSQIFTCPSWKNTRTCGPTSVAMAVSYLYNQPLNGTLVGDYLKTLRQDWPCGDYTSISSLSSLLTEKGINYKVKYFDSHQLINALSAGHPVVTPVFGQNFSTNQIKTSGDVGHFMLVVGVNQAEMIANDPGRSLEKYGKYRHFHLADYLTAWWKSGKGSYHGIEIIGPWGTGCQGTSTQACGSCGTQTRSCAGGSWTAWSNCLEHSCGGPMIQIMPGMGSQGTEFLMSGSGFYPYGSITIIDRRPDGSMPQLPSAVADINGNLSYPLRSSSSTLLGIFTLSALDDTTSRASNQATITITSLTGTSGPLISITPSQGPRGTTFVINGTGFSINAWVTISNLKPDGSYVTYQAATDSSGKFQYSLTSDGTTLLGTRQIGAMDNTNGKQSNGTTLTVTS